MISWLSIFKETWKWKGINQLINYMGDFYEYDFQLWPSHSHCCHVDLCHTLRPMVTLLSLLLRCPAVRVVTTADLIIASILAEFPYKLKYIIHSNLIWLPFAGRSFRLLGIHVTHEPWVMHFLLAIFWPFLSHKIRNRVILYSVVF